MVDAATLQQRLTSNECTYSTGCRRPAVDGTPHCKRHRKKYLQVNRAAQRRRRDRAEAAGLWRSCGHRKEVGQRCAVCVAQRRRRGVQDRSGALWITYRDSYGVWREEPTGLSSGDEDMARAALAEAIGREDALARSRMDSNSDDSGFVYFIQSVSGPIKIGSSADPGRRLATLQTAHYETLTLRAMASVTDAPSVEGRLHDALAEHRLSGEWFNPAIPIVELMEAIERGEEPPLLAWAIRGDSNSTDPSKRDTL